MSTPAVPGELGHLLPLSQDLIVSVLDARGFKYQVDADGDAYGLWEGNIIYFLRIGEKKEMLQVRTLTRAVFDIERVPALHGFCNAWNHDRLWPKAYVHVDDDGTARVVGEVLGDCERGVTVAQIDQVMTCGIATGCQLADAAAEYSAD
jgi:hypothetical protein